MKAKLNKKISIIGKQEYPSKTTLNLVVKEQTSKYNRRVLVAAVLVAIAVGLFTKFAVLDRLEKERKAWGAVSVRQNYLESLESANSDYDNIFALYERYFASEEAQKQYVDAVDVLRIIDEKLVPNASVQSASLNNNVLSLMLKGIDLEQASWIYANLTATEEIVADVDIQSSKSSDEENAVTMTITLTPEGKES